MIEVACRHGRAFQFRPQNNALLVIDMQRDFCAPDGASGVSGEDVSRIQEIIPRLREVLDAARQLGLTIVHTREGHLPDLSDLPSVKRQRSRDAGAEIGAQGPLGRILVRGEYGHDFVDELKPGADESVIDKPGFGAFYQTPIEEMLCNRGIESVILTGVTTQCCVHSSLREAVDRGYYCLTLEHCCAAFEENLHRATLEIIASEGHLFGWVSSSQEFLQATRA